MNHTRSYIIAVASVSVAWIGFCFNIGVANNCKADVITATVTLACILISVTRANGTDPRNNTIRQVASIAVPGWIGVVASYVGVFVV